MRGWSRDVLGPRYCIETTTDDNGDVIGEAEGDCASESEPEPGSISAVAVVSSKRQSYLADQCKT